MRQHNPSGVVRGRIVLKGQIRPTLSTEYLIMITRSLLFVALMLATSITIAADEDPVFSGPQAGEKVTTFKTRFVLGENAGQQFDVVTTAEGKPVLIIFVHEVTRPSVGLTRLLMNYAEKRAADGLHPAVVFLTDDATQTETWMKRAQHALPRNVPVGISVDGKEGPGAYGLNRAMTMTVLVAKDNAVTANFALVQPSVQADGPKILKAIVDALGGGEVPTLASLGGERYMRRNAPADDLPSPRLAELLRAVIQKTANDEQVDAAAQKVDDYMAENEPAKKQVQQIARRIVDAGKLENYGTAKAQAHIRRWAAEE